MKKNFLITTNIDQVDSKKYNKSFLGYHCISEEKFSKKFVKNILSDKTNYKKILKNYWLIQKLSNELLKLITNRLKVIHDNKYDNKYWKTILYPWICSYTSICVNRWQTIEHLKSRFKKEYFSYHYILDKEITIYSHSDFVEKSKTDIFNSDIFVKLIEYRDLKNILFIRKKIDKKNEIKNIQHDYKLKNIFISLYNKIILFFNRIYFDKLWFPKKDFIKLCIKNFQIPSKNKNTLNIKSKNKLYDISQREVLDFKIDNEISLKNFILENIKFYMPLSYLENFQDTRTKLKKYTKKRLIFSMSWFWWDDNFKIFLAESIIKGSKLINGLHGAGIHSKYSENYTYFEDLSHKIFVWSKKNITNKKSIYLCPTLPVTKKKREIDPTKFLINYYEPSKYMFKITLDTGLENAITNFNELLRATGKLKKTILKEVKFRSKGNYSINSEKKFSEKFGLDKIENYRSKEYLDSISESRLVVCYYPQTSFTESIYLNVPTILITDINFFDNKVKKNILKKFKHNNMFFNNTTDAFKFINKNWFNLEEWWKSNKVQVSRKLFLDNFFDIKSDNLNDWQAFIKKELSKLR